MRYKQPATRGCRGQRSVPSSGRVAKLRVRDTSTRQGDASAAETATSLREEAQQRLLDGVFQVTSRDRLVDVLVGVGLIREQKN